LKEVEAEKEHYGAKREVVKDRHLIACQVVIEEIEYFTGAGQSGLPRRHDTRSWGERRELIVTTLHSQCLSVPFSHPPLLPTQTDYGSIVCAALARMVELALRD
uniref:GMC_oxred_C domain-containing protein n=1 Tax=Hydatigena taeniaeformis TaxID=6205 RepID=A0A0R3XBH9_HYDTA